MPSECPLIGSVLYQRFHCNTSMCTVVWPCFFIATCLIPISFHLAMMGVAILLQGIGYGFIQSGKYKLKCMHTRHYYAFYTDV